MSGLPRNTAGGAPSDVHDDALHGQGHVPHVPHRLRSLSNSHQRGYHPHRHHHQHNNTHRPGGAGGGDAPHGEIHAASMLSEENRKAVETVFDARSPITSSSMLAQVLLDLHIVWDDTDLAHQLRAARYVDGDVVSRGLFLSLVSRWAAEHETVPESSPRYLFAVLGGGIDGSGWIALRSVLDLLSAYGLADDTLTQSPEADAAATTDSFDDGSDEARIAAAHRANVAAAAHLIQRKLGSDEPRLDYGEFVTLMSALEAPPTKDPLGDDFELRGAPAPRSRVTRSPQNSALSASQYALEMMREQLMKARDEPRDAAAAHSGDVPSSSSLAAVASATHNSASSAAAHMSPGKDGGLESTVKSDTLQATALTDEELAVLAGASRSRAASRYLNHFELYRAGSSLAQLREMRQAIREYLLKERQAAVRVAAARNCTRGRSPSPHHSVIDRFNETEGSIRRRVAELQSCSPQRVAEPEVHDETNGADDAVGVRHVKSRTQLQDAVHRVVESVVVTSRTAADGALACWTKSSPPKRVGKFASKS